MQRRNKVKDEGFERSLIKPTHLGLRHLALTVTSLEACTQFYVTHMGMTLVWQPDADNVYLSSGSDNLALHRYKDDAPFQKPEHLDHFGFFLAAREDVDAWYDYLKAAEVDIALAPKDHRDGTRSLYCRDPEGNVIQLIYVPL